MNEKKYTSKRPIPLLLLEYLKKKKLLLLKNSSKSYVSNTAGCLVYYSFVVHSPIAFHTLREDALNFGKGSIHFHTRQLCKTFHDFPIVSVQV